MQSFRQLTSKIISLEKVKSPSTKTYLDIIGITIDAFKQEKPLFLPEEKFPVGEVLKKLLPLFDHAYRQYARGLEVESRQHAQISRSGLQFIFDDLSNENNELGEKLNQFLKSEPVKLVEDFIENTTGINYDYGSLWPVDMATIPESHYWWFFIETDK
ncbi:unnamed protein product [Adineta steineri]|uniref:Uncharacterized protein n=1 Tax=Adineta steineri TaxID=433720 RepID=A0A819S4V4_9BILA|nr:unnamed protein product [Adineta steineri]CAF4053316.1 unnamed protein product [Adineta steineri]